MGSLTHFRPSRKPAAAGSATNCLSCPAEINCTYSALKIYKDIHLARKMTGWPVKIVCPDIEDTLRTSGMASAEALLLRRLGEDYDAKTTPDAEVAARPWFGRCVYEADNDVCDDQVVTISWDDDPLPDESVDMPTRLRGRGAKIATFHMIAGTEKQCERRGRIYGSLGEVSYDSETISLFTFASQETEIFSVPKPHSEEETGGHGGGDYGLTSAFVDAVDAVKNQGWDVRKAQAELLGCTLDEVLRSHAVVFAAEQARREGRVIRWKDWWSAAMASSVVQPAKR
jgi:hypothetical protein